MQSHRRLSIVGCLTLLAATHLAAQTPNADHDGLWSATLQCGQHLQSGRPGFTNRTEFTLLRGHILDTMIQVQAGNREETRWEGQASNGQLLLDGQARRDTGASWSYQFSGKLAPERFTLIGTITAQAQKVRECTIELTLSKPAPGSLAARSRATVDQAVAIPALVAPTPLPTAALPVQTVPPVPTAPAVAAGHRRIESRAGTTYVAAVRPPAKASATPVASTPAAAAEPAAPATPTAPVQAQRGAGEATRLIAQAKAAYERKDYAGALKIYAPLADEGQAQAQTGLGLLYEFGDGVPTKAATACAWYRKSAEQGEAEGQDRLGDCYRDGSGVKADLKQAIDWYTRSAAQRCRGASYHLAGLYEDGQGVPRNIGKAIELFTVAANASHEMALLHLGRLYSEGTVVPRDDVKAFGWYDKAARQGSDEGQNHLAEMHAKGRGTPQSDAQAVVWWRKAAEQGFRKAQNQLGLQYDLGKGVAKDAVQAVSWYRKAADQGDTSAMVNMGTMYECGSGVAKDLVAAKTWYVKAMKADDPDGLRAAVRLDQAARHAAMPGLRDGSQAVAGPCAQ